MRSVSELKKVIFVVFLVFSISFSFSLNSVYGGGLIEFKKAYVINSPDVCEDRLCDERYKATSYKMQKNQHSPLGQFKLGIPIDKITCNGGLEFVLKLSNWHPACVKPENVARLIEIGWAANVIDKEQIFKTIAEKETLLVDPLKEYRKYFPIREGLDLSIRPDVIQENHYLIFEGYGWHGLHNVEITISNQTRKIDFVMSQTDIRGELYMPWRIPANIDAGWYHIYATDGIHEYEIEIPIILPQ